MHGPILGGCLQAVFRVALAMSTLALRVAEWANAEKQRVNRRRYRVAVEWKDGYVDDADQREVIGIRDYSRN